MGCFVEFTDFRRETATKRRAVMNFINDGRAFVGPFIESTAARPTLAGRPFILAARSFVLAGRCSCWRAAASY